MLSLVRPDLQHAAGDLSKHLVAPTQLDLQQLKHCLRYIKGTQRYQLHLRPQPPAGIHLPLAAGQQNPLLIERYSEIRLGRRHQHQTVNIRIVGHPSEEQHAQQQQNTTGHSNKFSRSRALRHQLNHLRRYPPQAAHHGD